MITYREYDTKQQYVEHQSAKNPTNVFSEKFIGGFVDEISAWPDCFEGSFLCLGARSGAEVVALKRCNFFADGIDVNPRKGIEKVKFGDFHAIPFDDNAYDNIYCNCIDHCQDLDKVLSESKRVLNSGYLVLRFARRSLNGKFESCFWSGYTDIAKAVMDAGFIIDYLGPADFKDRRDRFMTLVAREEIQKIIPPREFAESQIGTIMEPWFTRSAIEKLDKILMPDSLVVEYGCGSSSFWLAERCKFVCTVEHNSEWFTVVEKVMSRLEVKNWKGFWIPCTQKGERKYRGYSKGKRGYFKSYSQCKSVWQYLGIDTVDCIIVDGRARNACVREAIKHLSENGILILDDTHRSRYNTSVPPRNWRREDFENKHGKKTTLWQKIST